MPTSAYFAAVAFLDFASGAVAVAISFAAYRYSRLLSGAVPRSLELGFSLMGLGLLLQGAMSAAFALWPVDRLARLFAISSYLYSALEVVSYLVLAIGYTGALYSGAALSAALPPFAARRAFIISSTYFGATQLASVFLLSLIVFDAALIRSRTGSAFSPLVIAAFSLMLAGHAIMLLSIVAFYAYYLLGNLVRFVGFAFLLLFLLRGRYIG